MNLTAGNMATISDFQLNQLIKRMLNVQNNNKNEFIIPQNPLYHALHDHVHELKKIQFFIKMAAILGYSKPMQMFEIR